MADLFIAYDPTADAGERLAPEVREEIAEVAPSAVLNGSITTAKLANDSVTTDKIAAGAVTSVEIATNGVGSVNIAADAVTEGKIATNAVTPDKCGTGVVTAWDNAFNAQETLIVFCTSAQYAALNPPLPAVLYFVSA